MKNSPVARTSPKHLPVIPGVTCDAVPAKDKPKLPSSVQPKGAGDKLNPPVIQISKGKPSKFPSKLAPDLTRLSSAAEEKKHDEPQFDMDM